MKLRGYVKDVVISLVAGVFLEIAILPTIASEYQDPEPTPLEVSLELSFNIEVKTMK